MSETATPVQTAEATNRRARERALAVLRDSPREPTSLVGYASRGRVLVIGEDDHAVGVAGRLASPLQATVVIVGGALPKAGTALPVLWSAPGALALEGHLGAFRATLAEGGKAAEFDLVLDLSARPLIGAELPPPGYYAPRSDPEALERALAELPERVGEFDKPRYFGYDPQICARGRRGVEGCRLCVDACPAEAITALVERIEVDPHLCQGGGACASVCPTGAISYRFPRPADSLRMLRRLLEAYRSEGGTDPMILVHDEAAGSERLAALSAAEALPGNVLPFAVEEVASLGPEAWLAALCYGARAVRLLGTPEIPSRSRSAVDAQLAWVRPLLEDMGYPVHALGWLEDAGDWAAPEAMPPIAPATFGGGEEKRRSLYFALDHLHAQSPRRPAITPLPAGAPLGRIAVRAEGCTLCLACAGVCPAGAIGTGSEGPALLFYEANCVQCGLCASACPEQVITLEPRLVHDVEARNRAALLKEEEPFRCVSCGKPFGTRSGIERVLSKLEGHWMFQDERARRRLQMCDQCRAADIMTESEGAGLK